MDKKKRALTGTERALIRGALLHTLDDADSDRGWPAFIYSALSGAPVTGDEVKDILTRLADSFKPLPSDSVAYPSALAAAVASERVPSARPPALSEWERFAREQEANNARRQLEEMTPPAFAPAWVTVGGHDVTATIPIDAAQTPPRAAGLTYVGNMPIRRDQLDLGAIADILGDGFITTRTPPTPQPAIEDIAIAPMRAGITPTELAQAVRANQPTPPTGTTEATAQIMEALQNVDLGEELTRLQDEMEHRREVGPRIVPAISNINAVQRINLRD